LSTRLECELIGGLRRLFEYRFDRGNGLNGHSFGNLFLTALTELTGRSEWAIAEAGRLLGVKGEVLPVTLSDHACALSSKMARSYAAKTPYRYSRHRISEWNQAHLPDPPAVAYPAALAAIQDADAVVIGPGDLYTSVLPNLLVAGIPSAIRNARNAHLRLQPDDQSTARPMGSALPILCARCSVILARPRQSTT